MNNKKLLKILIPILIVITIGGMWFVKNRPQKEENVSNQNEQVNKIPQELQNVDFSLSVAEAIDFETLSEYGLPIIADYGSDSCIPCKAMAPILKTMNEEFKGKAFIKFVDVWENYDAANNVPIQLIPTQVLFEADGTPFVPSKELQQEIEFVMYTDKESGEHIFTVHQGALTESEFRKILKEMGVE